MCVDDVDLNATQDTADGAAFVVAKATDRLLTEFERLGLQVGLRKCMVLGSCKLVKDRLAAHMSVLSRGRCIPLKVWGKKPGVQYTMRQRRLSSVMKAGLKRAGVRSSRVSKLQRGASKQQRHRLYNTAVRPVATYGGAFCGFQTLRSTYSDARWLMSMEERGVFAAQTCSACSGPLEWKT